jgi:hypothetical protein
MNNRSQLATLKARYHSGAVPLKVYDVIRQVETDLSWKEYKEMNQDDIPQSERRRIMENDRLARKAITGWAASIAHDAAN